MSNGTRRRLLQSAAALGASQLFAPFVAVGQTANSANALRVMRWKNFVPEYEAWFNDVFVKDWGRRNDIDVQVTNVGFGDLEKFAAAEIAAGQGHDLTLFLSPKPSLEDHVIDHRTLNEECEFRFGKPYGFVPKSTFNPRTGVHHGFIESFVPTLTVYRKDIWDTLGTSPKTWDDIRQAGRAAKLLHDVPVGISFASEHNAEHSQRALMAAFGAAIQDADGRPALASKNTVEALAFARALFEETMHADVLTWTPPSNNLEMLAGTVGLTIDTMSIIRAAEAQSVAVEPDLALGLLPEGPKGGGGPAYGTNTWVIWKFANNKSAAMKFLLDYMAAFRGGLLESGFQNMPAYPGTVPDLDALIDTSAGKRGRYNVLHDVPNTLTNLGYPGYSNAATDEVLSRNILTKMFASVATGRLMPQEATEKAQAAIIPIFEKWQDAGKI
ncbi:MAG: extracellular solute-binding protein [Paracoccaceae bacterium]